MIKLTKQNIKAGLIVITDPFVLNVSGTQVGDNWFIGSGAVVQLVRKIDNNV